MILVTHSLVGAAILKPLDNNWLVFLVIIFSHFLLDALPHYDYEVGALSGLPQGFRNKLKALFSRSHYPFFIKVSTDYLLAITLPFILIQPSDFSVFLKILVAISAALLPDFFIGFWRMFPSNKVFYVSRLIHQKVHTNIRFEGRPVLGMSLNIAYTLAALYFILILY